MPLSEYEQRVLSQMEQQLRSDPRLVSTFTSEQRYSGRRLALGTLAVLAGLAMLVGGVAASLVWLGVLGFVAMLGGVMLAISKPRGAAPKAPASRPRSSRPAAPQRGGFMQRLEERWDRRRDQRGR
ncbi:Protein of unknown function [Georgenia satyanarayanai]|uniref:DUF3040 domain-containing protein n=1 Tax=Georgenia satyanarayanai TaxID=860221 RepID=A0A2Y9AC07_9MICO|nr:DUF3040 domain-containing protein [Georgenia satyanarayanai]PYF99837.1 Protein of unknown function (DUF3040) [Georgenia satyanarayanai]SSA41820.1 Protein of unknown function [Georgenia satyanarayanai]